MRNGIFITLLLLASLFGFYFSTDRISSEKEPLPAAQVIDEKVAPTLQKEPQKEEKQKPIAIGSSDKPTPAPEPTAIQEAREPMVEAVINELASFEVEEDLVTKTIDQLLKVSETSDPDRLSRVALSLIEEAELDTESLPAVKKALRKALVDVAPEPSLDEDSYLECFENRLATILEEAKNHSCVEALSEKFLDLIRNQNPDDRGNVLYSSPRVLKKFVKAGAFECSLQLQESTDLFLGCRL